MFSSASTFRKSSSSNASGHRVLLAEVPEDVEAHPEEAGDPEAGDGENVYDEHSSEAYLQAEVECLATELQEAEDHGADPDLICGVEADFEQADEALVTMKEAPRS